MDYKFIMQETTKNFNKMILAELNSIQPLTESIMFQVRQKNNNNKVRTTTFLKKGESPKAKSTLKLFNNNDVSEHLYNVVQSYLMSLTEYINSTKERLQSHHSPAITTPSFCSLSTVCSMLWKRVQEISNSEKETASNSKQRMIFPYFENRDREGDVTNFSNATQTENSCLIYCESCYLSTKLLKNLVQIILTEQSKYGVEDSLVASYREEIGTNVFELSQWGAMQGWIKAVQGDLKRAAAFLSQTVKELNNVKVNQEAERKKHDNSMNNLKDGIQMVKSQLEAEQAQNAYLTLQIENLNKALEIRIRNMEVLKKSLTEQRMKFEEIIQSMDGIKNKITQLKKSHEHIRSFVGNNFSLEMCKLSELNESVQVSIQLIQHTASSQYKNEKRKLLGMQMNMCEKDEEINQHVYKYNAANKENSKLKEKNEALNTALLNQKEEFTIKNNELLGIISKLERKMNEEKGMKEHSHEIEQNPTVDFDENVSGNPIKDMEQQRQINKQKIRILIRENESLKLTIRKLKGIGSVKSYESSLNE